MAMGWVLGCGATGGWRSDRRPPGQASVEELQVGRIRDVPLHARDGTGCLHSSGEGRVPSLRHRVRRAHRCRREPAHAGHRRQPSAPVLHRRRRLLRRLSHSRPAAATKTGLCNLAHTCRAARVYGNIHNASYANARLDADRNIRPGTNLPYRADTPVHARVQLISGPLRPQRDADRHGHGAVCT